MLRARFKGWLEQLLHTHDTPRRTAAAYTLGVFFGFSPLLELHTVLGVLAAFLLNLNRVAVILGIYSNLPWVVPAYYTVVTIAGAALLRVEVAAGLLQQLSNALRDASWREFRQLAHMLSPLFWAFVLGSTLGALLLAGVAYRTSLTMMTAHRRHFPRGTPRSQEERLPQGHQQGGRELQGDRG